jgi:hypothetical protein
VPIQIQANATVLLAHIANQCSAQVAHEVLESGGVLALVPLLAHPHASLQGNKEEREDIERETKDNNFTEYGALALGNIAQASPEARSAIIQAGAIPPAVALLVVPGVNGQV